MQRGLIPRAPSTVTGSNDRCFNYGQLEHIARNCPTPKTHCWKDMNYNNCDKSGYLSRDCRAPYGGTYGQTVQGQARLNAIIPEEAGFDEEEQQNMEGTLMLFYSHVKALFDTGASNSFIAVRMMNDLGLVPQ